ncbi:hypothetical protein Enr13x_58710 [Stieleria neptunia]|uniref:HD domain-containing protein n=1 Tax=Stieleria neptunia TaxID=2527979 RepID=A0A518HYV5_9BACT|nr:phosphonate degradation HD-domain oxygenase [Stieleria neptunia]QDV45967.1 hypothetical protein Enr13x_58710 [Stieleria neptunia]
MTTTEQIIKLFDRKGDSEYGGEPVTQREHALQAAFLALQADAKPSLIVAALLHDIGHLLHDLPDDAPDAGIDDHHERSGDHFLRPLFSDAVTEPVRMHVEAKRYLCAVDPDYMSALSEPSRVSLALQGGPMTAEEAEQFIVQPFAEDAVRLRRWDDEAKIAGLETPPLDRFAEFLTQQLVSTDRK